MGDHTWGSWTAYSCPFCDRRGLKGRGGQRAHIRIKHPDEYVRMVFKELRLEVPKDYVAHGQSGAGVLREGT